MKESTDQGEQFESKVIKELCNLTGMTNSQTTRYHPMGEQNVWEIQPDRIEYAWYIGPIAEKELECLHRIISTHLQFYSTRMYRLCPFLCSDGIIVYLPMQLLVWGLQWWRKVHRGTMHLRWLLKSQRNPSRDKMKARTIGYVVLHYRQGTLNLWR